MHWSIHRVVADRWDGVLCDEDEIEAPTLEDVLRVIAALDAKTRTMVSLFGPDNSYLCIGGGLGQYVAYASTSDGHLWNLLLDSDDRKAVVLVNPGGQEGDFPARQVLDKSRVLHAARSFFETGVLDAALRWERQI
jgi:hypothetical protein